MRDYAKASPVFWMRGSGKRLRGDFHAQAVAHYLLYGPGSNMIGLYHLSVPTLAHHIGSPFEGALEALRRVEGVGLAAYDEASELVWVFNAAKIEFGDGLKLGDNRISAINKLLESFGNHPFVRGFIHLYGAAYHLAARGVTAEEWNVAAKPLASPFEGASQQKQKQKQKQEQLKPVEPQAASTAPKRGRVQRSPEEQAKAKRIADAFKAGYQKRYNRPLEAWGAPENTHVYHLLLTWPEATLEALARAYFEWPNKRAIDAGHPFMKGYASFSATVAELHADTHAAARRKEAAQVGARIRLGEDMAIEDDATNRMNIQAANQKDPFNDDHWRNADGDAGRRENLAGSASDLPRQVAQGGGVARGDSQQKALGGGTARVVSSAGPVREGIPDMGSVPRSVRVGADAIDRAVQDDPGAET